MRVIFYSFIIGAGILLKASLLFSQQLDYKSLETSIQQVVKKVSGATVAVTSYDTSRGRKNGLTFSAVVVSADGYILSASHAVSASQTYQVEFSDGKKVLATGLGSIQDLDAAVIKIIPTGNWPHAEMGWSSSLLPFQPCISLGYPANMPQSGHALVRFGYVTESRLYPGFLCNTALMEPGDSGGPLFDLNGRVIGIHSRIAQSMDANFEVPVDEFRKHWDKLIVAQNYFLTNPMSAQNIDSMPVQLAGKPIPELEKLNDQFPELLATIASTCLNISSKLKGEEANALGTLLSPANDNSYIISKSSIVGNDSIFVSYKENPIPAMVIARDSLKDLVLLKINVSLKDGINIFSGSSDKVDYSGAGKFLLSPGTHYVPVKVSVLSSPTISFIQSEPLQPASNHLAEQFEAGKSLRKGGFNKVFIHDARLYPTECGGPVFDTDGHFMGINIARVCRTSSIAIPAEEVRSFLQAALKIAR